MASVCRRAIKRQSKSRKIKGMQELDCKKRISLSFISYHLILSLFGCVKTSDEADESREGLGKLLDVPFGARRVLWKMVALPENNDSGIPGPTDFVGLVAIMWASPVDLKKITSKLPEFHGNKSVPPLFIKKWIPDAVAAALRNPVHARDARSWLIRPALKAFVSSFDDGLVLYAEYVSR